MVPPGAQWLFRLGPIGMALIRGQVRGLARKYPKPYNEKELKTALAKMRSGVQASSSGYLVGNFLSFAGVLFTLCVIGGLSCTTASLHPIQLFFNSWRTVSLHKHEGSD